MEKYYFLPVRFVFVQEGAELHKEDLPFDMFGVDFGHRGDDCTFETLRKAFNLFEIVRQEGLP